MMKTEHYGLFLSLLFVSSSSSRSSLTISVGRTEILSPSSTEGCQLQAVIYFLIVSQSTHLF